MFQAPSVEVVEHQITFPLNPTTAIQQALERRWPKCKQFGNNGVLAVLQRSANRGLIVSNSNKSFNASKNLQRPAVVFWMNTGFG